MALALLILCALSRARQRVGHAPAGGRWIRVAKREADIYEFLWSDQERGHGLVGRAVKDRALSTREPGKRDGQ
jgi:hypothetical protein